MKTRMLLCCFALALAACGDKTPEYKPAKDVGNIPKQTLDKAMSGTQDALQKGADRDKAADDQKQ